MLPPVKFNMLGQMQLRGNGGSSSSSPTSLSISTTTTSTASPTANNSSNSMMNISPESKADSGCNVTSSNVSTPSSSSSSPRSPSSSQGGEESATLSSHESSKKVMNSNSVDMLFNGGGNVNLPFGLNSHHHINSAFAWQLANSSQLIDHRDTRSNNQNGCRGAGDGVAVGGINFNVNALTSGHHHQQQPQHHQNKRSNGSATSTTSASSNNNLNFQQQHGISKHGDPITHHQQQHHLKTTNNREKSKHSGKAIEIEVDIKEEKETGAVSSGSEERAESPLDFSTKKKFKAEPRSAKNLRPRSESLLAEFGVSDQQLTRETSDSPCSRLRNILSMKSPSIPEEMPGTVLNLSKESPTLSAIWCKTESPSRNSNSSSPVLSGGSGGSPSEHATAFVKSNSPRPATIPISMGAPTVVVPPVGLLGSNGSTGVVSSNGTSSIGLPSWGSGVYSPSLSPILNQQVPANNGPLSLSFETSPTLFPHHITAGAASPALPFPPSLSLPLSSNAPTTGSKGRVTRPFKAYPKDPLTFSSVGLYGLPLGTAPGTTEAVIHQQSNQAYAEFRKQMLSSSQFGKARRGGHKNNTPYSIPGDSTDGHISDSGSMFKANDSGSASDDGSSPSGKNRLGKTEQQMKDEAYWERRRKNNEAAKRSRDARRAKEDEIAIRAAFLEQENLKLRFEVCALKSETAKLRCMLYSS